MTEEHQALKKSLSTSISEAREIYEKPGAMLKDITERELFYAVYLFDNTGKQEKWCIAQQLGISTDVVVPEKLERAIQVGETGG